MTQKLIILGTGGNCIDILDTVHDINAIEAHPIFECIGFLDDDPQKWNMKIEGVPVLGPLDSAADYPDCCFVNGIGSPFNFWKKKTIISKTRMPLSRFKTVVHPTATVSKMAQLGDGVVVLQNVTITSNVKIGNHVIILPNSVISHDDVINDYTSIAGGVCISGGVVIGESSYIGTNSAILGNVTIGRDCLVGMGSVVLADVSENSVVVGNPAKFLRQTKEK